MDASRAYDPLLALQLLQRKETADDSLSAFGLCWSEQGNSEPKGTTLAQLRHRPQHTSQH